VPTDPLTLEPMATEPAKVSVVILNWRNAEATASCVDSVRAQSTSADVEVVIVDNESTATSRAELTTLAANRVVPARRNLGFAGGMNLGAAAATGRVIALLNNDLVLGDDWLERGLDALAAHPEAGMVGGISYQWDERNPPFDETNDYWSFHFVDHVSGTSTLLRRSAARREVPSLDGSNLMIRREVWDRIGGFDADYFAYGEDTDLAARCMAAGWSAVYEPAMRTWHRRNLSSDEVRFRRAYWSRRNAFYTVAHHFPESEWKPACRRLALNYVWFAVAGRQGGLRQWPFSGRLDPTARVALAAAAAWSAVHTRKLARKRREVISAGLHDEGWTERVRRLNPVVA
jgi:hypothetical protein